MTGFPTQIGKYRIERLLGRGAMGTVYQGLDPDIQRPVAIKLLHPHLLNSTEGPALRERFRREAQAAARCLHPNIVTVFELGHADNTDFIVSELIEGEDLKSYLESGTRFSLQEIGLIIGGLLKGLAAAHAQGIVHRDIKPANILLLDQGSVKVADFGIARLQASDLTLAGFMVGSPGYMSPECLRGEDVDLRTDLYSTGVVLLELLTGEKARLNPLADDQDFEIQLKEMLAKATDPTIGHALQSLLYKALARDPAGRFASATDFATALAKALDIGSLQDETLMGGLSETLIRQRPQLPEKTSKPQSWSPELLKQLEQELTTWLGPIAPRLVKSAASRYSNSDSLIEALASNIGNAEEKERFKQQIGKSISQSSISSNESIKLQGQDSQTGTGFALTDEEFTAIRTRLANYLGPMAATLIRRCIPKASNQQELLQRLAEQIPNANDQASFLKQ